VEAEVKAGFDDAEVEIIEGDHGVFDIAVDDKMIFSRGCSAFGKRFPRVGETTELIRQELGAQGVAE
jgi:predicted Rdx family selenoprotein